jgi:electron transport complex protein RnfD
MSVAVLCEWGFEKLCKKPSTIGDLSAAVTGLLLAFNLPVDIPLWQAAFGSLVAVVAIKQLFGGIGQNFANPAITARIVMFLAFSGTMSTWKVVGDAVSSATPLRLLDTGDLTSLPSLTNMLLGVRGGSLGETCIVALVAGGIYLLARRVITWHTPVAFIGTVFLFTAVLGQEPVYQVLSGGLVLGAFFMATDYSTTPQTPAGRLIFGVGCGLITVLIRVWGSYPEGVSFSILLMNILTPYITRWTRTKPFGGVKA